MRTARRAFTKHSQSTHKAPHRITFLRAQGMTELPFRKLSRNMHETCTNRPLTEHSQGTHNAFTKHSQSTNTNNHSEDPGTQRITPNETLQETNIYIRIHMYVCAYAPAMCETCIFIHEAFTNHSQSIRKALTALLLKGPPGNHRTTPQRPPKMHIRKSPKPRSTQTSLKTYGFLTVFAHFRF